MSEKSVDELLGRGQTFDFKLMIDQSEYYKVDVENGYFKMRSTQAKDWLDRGKTVIVIDNITGNKMLMTPFDFGTGISDNIFKRSYQEGKFATLTFKWEPEAVTSTEQNQWSEALLQRFHDTWFNKLKDYLVTPEFRTLNRTLNIEARSNKTIFPAKENVYRAFGTRADKIRVIFIGQDPYPNTHANGNAFATDQISKPISLRTIEKAIQQDLNLPTEWMIQNDLMNVIEQGVMFLNSGLTVEQNNPGSYTDKWRPFITEVIKVVNTFPEPVIFVTLGSTARSFHNLIDANKHIIFTGEHPAAASRNNREWEYNNIFSAINTSLKIRNIPEIKW